MRKNVATAIASLLFLKALDSLTTHVGLSLGGTELNYFYSQLSKAHFIFPLVLYFTILSCFYLLFEKVENYVKDKGLKIPLTFIFFTILNIITLIVVVNNLIVIFKLL